MNPKANMMKLHSRAATNVVLTALAFFFCKPLIVNSVAGSAVLQSVITLQRPNDSADGTGFGVVRLQSSPTLQEVFIQVGGVPQSSVGQGLGALIGGPNGDTNNFFFVNVLDGPGVDGMWKLDVKNSQALELYGVPTIASLTNRYLEIVDTTSNLLLQTLIQPLVPQKVKVGYMHHVKFKTPDPAPSAKAKGTLVVKLNPKTGASLIECRLQGLSSGNTYCQVIVPYYGYQPLDKCDGGYPVVNGSAQFKSDTSIGQQIGINALSLGYVRIDQISGWVVEVYDSFGVVHLYAYIPYP